MAATSRVPDLSHLPAYRAHAPQVPVWQATTGLPGCIHRFFDTSPISPSGRFLALTRLRDESRLLAPGEAVDVVVVDLVDGSHRVVARSRCADTQLGAHVQWGADDHQLCYNDLDPERGWTPQGVVLDPATGRERRLAGTIYMLSRDGRRAASPCLKRLALTQAGYGAVLPAAAIPLNAGAEADDGFWVTDLTSGEARLVLSFADMVERLGPEPLGLEPGGALYGFHVKWNPQGTRLMLVVRNRVRSGGWRPALLSCAADGGDLRVVIPASTWARGGHHPEWCPDGERILMNLRLEPGGPLRFVTVRDDGSGLQAVGTPAAGSGHPTLHPDGRHVLTDDYLHGDFARDDGTVPIRWVDLADGQERELLRISARPSYAGGSREMRVDQHPAWDRSHRYATINGCVDGQRHVFVLDLRELVG